MAREEKVNGCFFVKNLFCFCRIEPANEFYDGEKDNDKDADGFLDV